MNRPAILSLAHVHPAVDPTLTADQRAAGRMLLDRPCAYPRLIADLTYLAGGRVDVRGRCDREATDYITVDDAAGGTNHAGVCVGHSIEAHALPGFRSCEPLTATARTAADRRVRAQRLRRAALTALRDGSYDLARTLDREARAIFAAAGGVR